jgi:hypothetical protein
VTENFVVPHELTKRFDWFHMNHNDSAGHSNAAEPTPVSNPLLPSETKIFKKWRREFSLLTGYGMDPEERVFTINRRNCERWKKDLLNYSTSVFPLCLYIRSLSMHRQAHLCSSCSNTSSSPG